MPRPPIVDVLGVPVTAYPTTEALHQDLHDMITQKRHALVLNVNAHALNLSCEHPWLHAFFNRADAVFCDGKGVILAAWMLGGHIPNSYTYSVWLWQLSTYLAQQRFSIYLLGGKPGVAEQAAARLQAANPTLCIAGTHHGYFDHARGSAENRAVVGKINAARPDILLVCFGMPFQEAWLCQNWDDITASVALTGGGALDYAAGLSMRAPQWVRSIGMEWCWRMVIEPKRLWRRYILGNPLFIARVLRARGAARRSTATSRSER